MNKSQKTWIIIAISLLIIGTFLFAGAMTALDFDFKKLSTQKFETNTYEVSDPFDKISIDVTTTEITFASSDDAKCRVECLEEEKLKHRVVVQDGALIIDTIDTRKWYDHIGIFFGNMKMTVYLPQKEYAALSIETDTGDIEIPKDFSFEAIKVLGSTADIECYASASGSIEIDTDTGKIKAESLSAEELHLSTATGNIRVSAARIAETVNVATSTGDVRLDDVECKSIATVSSTGNVCFAGVAAKETLRAKASTGDIELEGSDAASIFIETSTGDVEGTLLSEKIFITETDTGDIRVPKTATGGRCEITTDTGDIEIDIG